MPIDTVQKLFHIRSKKNQHVMQNVARLWDISRQASTAQELLDSLHPWGKNNALKFHNFFSYLFILFALSSVVFGWFIAAYIPFALSILISLMWLFYAYLIYESSEPIDEVIDALELKLKLLKYDLAFLKLPPHLSGTINATLVFSKLKQFFPVFNQGDQSNDIISFASTEWIDQDGQAHPVLLFKYRYVSEMTLSDENSKKHTINKIKKDLWGAFIFKTEAMGVAISKQRDEFFYPYTQSWQSSDIQLNQHLRFFGYDQHQIAKSIRPALTLKLHDFFKHHDGDLIFHYEENMLCYLGGHNLFNTISKFERDDIQNISQLRGYLRTIEMPDYQLFKQYMLNLIS